VEKIEELGFKFTMSSSDASISDYDNNIFLHADVFFRSDDKDMLIAVMMITAVGSASFRY